MKPSTRLLGPVLALTLVWLTSAGATGIMIPKMPELPALAIKSHRVKVVIGDQVARTQVEQVFVNNTDRQLEATFVFPLPAGASVSEFAMMMNGKRVVGEVLEKQRARQIYTDIVRRMKDPGLLEYLGSNLFRASVFPIPARGEQKIDLSYSEVIKTDSGLSEYVFPLKTGEKYSRAMDDFSVSVELQSKIPIKTVYSPTHTVDVVKKSDTRVLVSCEEARGALDRDFRLLYALSGKDFGLNLLSHRPEGKDGYFLMMLAPKTDLKEKDVLPKDVCFVIDTSGSMSGPKIEQARKALEYCVNSLGAKDRFNIVRFSTDVELFSEALRSADKASRKEARDFISGLVARGGTDINWALEKALAMERDEKRPYLIVFLTDGKPTIGTTEPGEILNGVKMRNRSDSRIFVFGVGNEVNTHLLDQLADQTRATSQYVAPDEDIEVKVSSFYDKVNAPVLADVRIDLGKVGAYDVYPKRLPDLFKGTQLLVFGRYKKDGHVAIKLTGTLGDRDQAFVYEDTFAKAEPKNEFIPKLWASRKVGYLLDEIRLRGENEELVKEVITLSKEHGIMTPYTSYLVTEDEPARVTRGTGAPPPGLEPEVGFTLGDDAGGEVAATRTGPPAELPQGATRPRTNAGYEQSKAEGEAKEIARSLDENMDRPWGGQKPRRPSAGAGGGTIGGRGAEPSPEPEGATETELGNLQLLRADTGAVAVKASEDLRALKDTDSLSGHGVGMPGPGPVAKTVGERKFKLVKRTWVDASWKADDEPIKVKYISDAYFKLLEREPSLNKVFALGERVLVVLKSGKAILIGKEGKEDLTKQELDDLFAKK